MLEAHTKNESNSKYETLHGGLKYKTLYGNFNFILYPRKYCTRLLLLFGKVVRISVVFQFVAISIYFGDYSAAPNSPLLVARLQIVQTA